MPQIWPPYPPYYFPLVPLFKEKSMPTAREDAARRLSPTAANNGPVGADGPRAPNFVARSAKFSRALEQLERYARHDSTTLLLEGESGTGKTLLARHAHALSPRSRGVFRELSVAAIDDGLASSDLFGHVQGAFTDARQHRHGHFVSASGGTLFLDEIGKASLVVQTKLLHAVEYGTIWPVGADRPLSVDVRLITASNVSVEVLARSGAFLPDLVPRITAFRVTIPPLRERTADIPDLVDHCIALRAPRCGYGHALPGVSRPLMQALLHAEWPGNVRQLDSTIHRLLVDADGAMELTLDHCTEDLNVLSEPALDHRPRLTPEVADRAVREASGNISRAASRLGVARTTLYRHLNE